MARSPAAACELYASPTYILVAVTPGAVDGTGPEADGPGPVLRPPGVEPDCVAPGAAATVPPLLPERTPVAPAMFPLPPAPPVAPAGVSPPLAAVCPGAAPLPLPPVTANPSPLMPDACRP